MIFETNKDKGRAGMSLAIAYFGSNGYTVSIPLNDTQWYDLVVEKDGILQTVQCKATGSEDATIYLSSCGGTNGSVYDNVLKHPVDLLFCLDSKENIFVIPVNELRKFGVVRSISLRTSPTINGQGFQTYLYRVYLLNSQVQQQTIEQNNLPKKNICCDCGCEISDKATRCHKCASIAKSIRLSEMPISRNELKILIRTIPFCQIGKQFNVTDNAIRKWCKKYDLPSTKKDINLYSDDEWDLI